MAWEISNSGILKEIWYQGKDLRETLQEIKRLPLFQEKDFQHVYAMLPCNDETVIVTSSGLKRIEVPSKRALHHISGSSKVEIFFRGINRKYGEKRAIYLKPFVEGNQCLQPLSSIKSSPIWLNLTPLTEIEMKKEIYLAYPGDFTLELYFSKTSFLKLLNVGASLLEKSIAYHLTKVQILYAYEECMKEIPFITYAEDAEMLAGNYEEIQLLGLQAQMNHFKNLSFY